MSQIQSRARRIGELVGEATPAAVRERLAIVADLSRELQLPVYLVGGAVRDLLVTGELRDLDLMVEGSSAELAHALGERLAAPVKIHQAFLTAEVDDPHGPSIDIASCRAEIYPEPAALPVVHPGDLEQDLDRRDFTLNTLAIRIGPDRAFELIDAKGGLQDLEASLLRVLHPRSFIDDPTRAFRAVRLESRLDLRLDSESERLLIEAIENEVFDRLSASRLRQEIRQTFGDPDRVESSVRRLDELGLLGTLHPDLRFEVEEAELLVQVAEAVDWLEDKEFDPSSLELWRLVLSSIAWRLQPSARQELAGRLDLAGDDRALLVGSRERVESAAEVLKGSDVAPHVVARTLADLAAEELVLLTAVGRDEVEGWVERWLDEIRYIELAITGRDLVARGASPGPAIGAVLAATLEARIDGLIGAEEELSHALERLAGDEWK